MYYSRRQRLLWLINWLFLVVSFVIIGFLLVTQATGYRYNPHNHRLQKTGMFIITTQPRDSQLTVDNQRYNLASQRRIANILPGTYRIKITKTGYLPWEKIVTVRPGYVV